MKPLPLFMEHPAHNRTKTSRDAAADIRPHVATLRAQVLAFIAARGAEGATAEEVQLGTGLKGDTVRPRLCELAENGCIARSGDTRKTTSGRSAAVWRFQR